MTTSSRTARLGAVTRWPASALLLRATMLLAPLGALLLAGPAGDPPPLSMVVIVVLLSLGFALAPDSGAGLLALGSVVAWWCLVADDGLHPSVLVASVLVTAAHVAGLLAAYGPAGVRVETRVLSVWVARAAVVLLAAPVVWLVARLVDDVAPEAALWQSGLLVSALTLVGAVVTLGAVWSGDHEDR